MDALKKLKKEKKRRAACGARRCRGPRHHNRRTKKAHRRAHPRLHVRHEGQRERRLARRSSRDHAIKHATCVLYCPGTHMHMPVHMSIRVYTRAYVHGVTLQPNSVAGETRRWRQDTETCYGNMLRKHATETCYGNMPGPVARQLILHVARHASPDICMDMRENLWHVNTWV